MIIDVSNTLGRHRFKPEIKAGDLLKEMDRNHIDMAVIHSYAESMDNRSVYQAMKDHPKRFIGLYTVNPWYEDSRICFPFRISGRRWPEAFRMYRWYYTIWGFR